MRTNLPINELETAVPDHVYLISKTDLKGRITYVNQIFIDISGYSQQELLGSSHNIVRHPHMPQQLFKDLWHTLQNGRPWVGLIKNRRKDGGFYWVQARVIPLQQNGKITGYASVRIKAQPRDIEKAEQLYQSMQKRQTRHIIMHEGEVLQGKLHHLARRLLHPFKNSLQASLLRFGLLSFLFSGLNLYLLANNGASQEYLLHSSVALILAATGLLSYGWILSRRMLTPLANATLVAQQIATGNLLIDVHANNRNREVAQLYFYLDMMRKSLQGLAHDVRDGIHTSLNTSEVLAINNQRLSSRTVEQSSSLEQTATSMEEITVTVQQTADNARLADQLARESLNTAEQGGTVVQNMVSTMQDIQQSTLRISDIVSIIESIAFQTNILALNAAVESARAGTAGRGFAVVAAEVRQLAQKSAQAAGEIKHLIDDSVLHMNSGARQAEKAQQPMAEIMQSVRNVNQIIESISSASHEQAQGLGQINQAITDMDNVTKDNALLVDELGGTVEQLAQQAQQLNLAIELLNTETPKTINQVDPHSTAHPTPLIPVSMT